MKLVKALLAVLAVAFLPVFFAGLVFGVARTAFMAGNDLIDAIADRIAE